MSTGLTALCERYPDMLERRGVGSPFLPWLYDHFVAHVVGRPATAQLATTPRGAWDKLRALVGKIAPADEATAELVGWHYRVELFDDLDGAS